MNIDGDARHHKFPDIAEEETCHKCSSSKGYAHEIYPFKSLHVRILKCAFRSKKHRRADSRNLADCCGVLSQKCTDQSGNLSDGEASFNYRSADERGDDGSQFVLEDIEINGISIASV